MDEPNYEGDILTTRHKVATKEQCDTRDLRLSGGSGGYWLLGMPQRFAKLLRRPHAGARAKGKLKVCRRRNGKTGCVMHVRNADPAAGLLELQHCQYCGARCAACVCGKGKERPLPWAAFAAAALPYCEYCGKRLANAKVCDGCNTRELDVNLMTKEDPNRPLCVMRQHSEMTREGVAYSYNFDQVPISQRLGVVVPEAFDSEERKVVLADEGAAARDGVADYDGLANRGLLEHFEFKERPHKDVVRIVRSVMQKHEGKRMTLNQIVELSYETKRGVLRALKEIAVDEGRGLFTLKAHMV